LAIKMRMFANHGALKKHTHLIDGINSRLDTIQAAILNVKLPQIFKWNAMRLKNAQYYNEILKGIEEITLPPLRNNVKHIFHIYCIKTVQRELLMKYLNENGIETAIHYPVALPFMQTYKNLRHSVEDFPMAAKFQNEILSLPMYPELTAEKMDYIASKIKEFFNSLR